MRNWFSKMRVLLCMLLVLTMIAPCGIAQASTVSATQLAIGEDATVAPIEPQITYQTLADQMGQLFIDSVGVDSMQVAIMDHGKIAYSNAFGYNDKKTKTVLDKDTMYGVGSVSKMYTTAAIMHLVDQGKVELDKPVIDYVTDFKMKDSRYKKITVRMLLNHSSGLMGSNMWNALTITDSNTLHHDKFLEVLSNQYLQYEPGTLCVYNNDGFELAEVIIERVSKKTFTKYLEDEICKPLGLVNTKTPQSKFNRKKLAGIYAPTNREVNLGYEAVNTIGAGGIYSTAEDICKFGSVFMSDSNNTIVSSDSRKAMANKEYANGFWLSKENNFIAYGLGWDSVHYADFGSYGITALQKGGDTGFYHSTMTVLPDKGITIAVLSSGSSSANLALYSNRILLQYLDDKKELGTKKEEPQVQYEKTDLPADVDKLCGTYIASMNLVTSVSQKDNKLIVSYAGATFEFDYTKQGIYVNDKDPNTTVNFRTYNGKTYIEFFQIADAGPLGKIDASYVLGEKLAKNPISAQVKKVWKARSKKVYVIVDSLPSAAEYANDLTSACVRLDYSRINDGYLSTMKIVNKDLAYSQVEVPVMYGRNGDIVKFYKVNGVEYVTVNGYTAMCTDGVKNLSTKKTFKVTIPKTGYTQWFDISSKMANKKVTIKVPKKCSFVVYDKKGNLVTNYYLDKKNTVKLPKDGSIAFVGTKNAKFTVTQK